MTFPKRKRQRTNLKSTPKQDTLFGDIYDFSVKPIARKKINEQPYWGATNKSILIQTNEFIEWIEVYGVDGIYERDDDDTPKYQLQVNIDLLLVLYFKSGNICTIGGDERHSYINIAFYRKENIFGERLFNLKHQIKG